MKISNIYIPLLALIVGWTVSCKKIEHEIQDSIVSINEGTPSSVQVGQKLKVGFISNHVRSFEFAIVKEGSTILSEEITLEENEKIISREIDIPNEDSWIGEALLKISYDAGEQTVEKTKEIVFLESNPVMYLVGGSTGAGWSPESATLMRLYDGENSKNKFEIFEYITIDGDGFKFLPSNVGWDNAYGIGGSSGQLLQDGDAGNITVEEDAFYRVRMDADALTYELLKVTWGIIGDATAGGWDTSTDMTFEGARGTYVWKITTNLAQGELKFRYNNAWDFDGIPANLGGNLSELTWDGANISIESAGTYDIELSLSPSGYTASIQKQ